jgi:hypothetical protein
MWRRLGGNISIYSVEGNKQPARSKYRKLFALSHVLELLFDYAYGGNAFLRNAFKFLQDYTSSDLRRHDSIKYYLQLTITAFKGSIFILELTADE